MNIKNVNISDVFCGAVLLGVVSFFGYVLKAAHNMNCVANQLDMTMPEIVKASKAGISEAIVKEAVKQAASEAAYGMVSNVKEEAVKEAREVVSKAAQDAVNDAYSNVKDSVDKELRRQIGNLDIRRFKETIIKEAKENAAKEFADELREVKEKAAQKFNDDLDEILEGFNSNLNNVRKIYSSIAKACTNDVSHTDVYDFSNKKQNLKRFEIEIG